MLVNKLLKCANLKLAYKLLKQWRLPNCLEFRPTKIIFFFKRGEFYHWPCLELVGCSENKKDNFKRPTFNQFHHYFKFSADPEECMAPPPWGTINAASDPCLPGPPLELALHPPGELQLRTQCPVSFLYACFYPSVAELWSLVYLSSINPIKYQNPYLLPLHLQKSESDT